MPQDNPNFTLWSKLQDQGLYTKSYDEFKTQFAGHEKVVALFSAMKNDGHYTKTVGEFANQFFKPIQQETGTSPSETPTNIKIRDTRQTDMLSGKPLKDTARFHAEPDINYIQQVVATARKHNVDPYTALAVNLAETKFDPEKKNNPFMLGQYNQYGDVVDESIKLLADKLATAKRLGKTKEADQLQLWNGTGKISGKGVMYGVDTDKTPIDMSKTPLYGRRVIDLRENVLKKNSAFTKVVDEVMASNPALDRQYFK
jgi:hypothetical protein